MEDKEYVIDLAEMTAILKENYKPVARLTGIIIGLTIIFLIVAWYFFPVYESEAKLQIKQSQPSMMALMTGAGSSSETESYIEILKSRGVVIPVIEATEELNFFGKYPRYEDYVKKRITAESVQLTDIMSVKVRGKTAEQAQKANQLLIEGFLKRVGELSSTQKGSLKAFLTERVATAKEELAKAADALQKFKEENKIISPTANTDIFTQRVMDAEKQAAANKVELEAAEARLAAINQQLNGSGASSADNVTLQRYNEELAKLETTRIAYKDKYTEKHPRMIEINERIESLKAKIQEELDKVASLQAPSDNQVHQSLVAGKYSSEGAVKVARQKAEVLQRIIDQNNEELAKMPAMEQEYVRISRNYAVASEIYTMLVKQLEETKITEFKQPMNVLLVDTPHLPDKPAFPRRGLALIFATLMGLLISSAYVLIKEMKNHTVRNSQMVLRYANLPVFGSIPDKDNLTPVANDMNEAKAQNFLNKVKEFIWKK